MIGFGSIGMLILQRMNLGKSHNKLGAVSRRTVGGYTATVPVNDLADDGQTDTGALVFVLAVQPLEDLEDTFGVLLVEADTVVFDRDFDEVELAGGAWQIAATNANHGRD